MTGSLLAHTSLPFDAFKARLDLSMARTPGSGRFRRTWEGRTLTILGPGCRAVGSFEDGRFSGSIELMGPARLLRRRIYADMNRMLRDAGCDEIRVR